MECNICKKEFIPTKSLHYIARDCKEQGFGASLKGSQEPTLYDAFSCPFCGSQHIAQEFKRIDEKYTELQESYSKDDEEEGQFYPNVKTIVADETLYDGNVDGNCDEEPKKTPKLYTKNDSFDNSEEDDDNSSTEDTETENEDIWDKVTPIPIPTGKSKIPVPLNIDTHFVNYYKALQAIIDDNNALSFDQPLTEEVFLTIVANKLQDKLAIGTEIILQNRLGNTTIWVVGGTNHDGTTGTVDLISKDLILNSTTEAYYDGFGDSQIYRDSSIRKWLTEKYVDGFSQCVRNSLKVMDVDTDIDGVIVTTYDRIKILSMNELGITSDDWVYIPETKEGSKYPIFDSGDSKESNNKRIKYKNNHIEKGWYWTRTRDISNYDYIWGIFANGNFANANVYADVETGGIVPVIRF